MSYQNTVIDLSLDEEVVVDEQVGIKRKKQAKENVLVAAVKPVHNLRRRHTVFVNLVRTKNAESFSFKMSKSDSDKALADIVRDMVEGWNGMNQVVCNQSHTYLIYIDSNTIKVVDYNITSLALIEELLFDEGYRNYAKTILQLVPDKFPGRNIVVEPVDEVIKRTKEFRDAFKAGQGHCKIYRDNWALKNLQVNIA